MGSPASHSKNLDQAIDSCFYLFIFLFFALLASVLSCHFITMQILQLDHIYLTPSSPPIIKNSHHVYINISRKVSSNVFREFPGYTVRSLASNVIYFIVSMLLSKC